MVWWRQLLSKCKYFNEEKRLKKNCKQINFIDATIERFCETAQKLSGPVPIIARKIA
jgi:hypothetical protein